MRRFLIILCLLVLLLLTLCHAPLVIHGAHIGLELWYESVLPSILPFMIMTSLLLQQLPNRNICFLGLLCGLPIGANLIRQQLLRRQLSLKHANILLCICNLTSPMFISGYILHQTLKLQVSPLRFFLVIYTPILLYAIFSYLWQRIHPAFCHAKQVSYSSLPVSSFSASSALTESAPLDVIIRQSLESILKIGIYIMLFCILTHFILTILPSNLPSLRYLTACLEITNGIHLIASASISIQQKTALIAGLTSFGGICSIFQTQSVISGSGLSILHYTIVKLCMGITSYFLAYFWCF